MRKKSGDHAEEEKGVCHEVHFENGNGYREEGEPWNTDGDFRDLTFLNAGFVEDDFIVAEKGSWKNGP